MYKFHVSYENILPQERREITTLKLVDLVVVQWRNCNYNHDIFNIILDLSENYEDVYKHIITTKNLDNMKRWLSPLISDKNVNQLEAGAGI